MTSKHVVNQPAGNAVSALLFISLMNERQFCLAVDKTLDAMESCELLVIRGCCVELLGPSRVSQSCLARLASRLATAEAPGWQRLGNRRLYSTTANAFVSQGS